MKMGWLTKTLGDVCQLISGQHIDAKNYNTASRGVGYLTGPSDFGQLNPIITKWTEHPKITAKRGDVLITVKGSGVGKINLLDEKEVAISRQLMAIRVTGADPYFIYAILSSTFDHFQSLSTGAAIPGISREQVLGLQIPLPPLAEQQRIVATLDKAFAGLATAKANTEKNLQNARAIFESHLQSVFTQRGPGWVEKTLGELCQIKTGKKDVNQGNPEGQYPFFTCAAEHTYSDVYSFDTEALLIAGNGNVGQVSYYSGKFEAYQRTYVLFDFRGVTAKYLFRVLDKHLSTTVGKQKLGNTMPYIKIGMLTDFPVPIPPGNELARVTEHLDVLAAETQRLARIYEQKLTALDALKQSLLHQAFNGQL